MSTLIRVRQCKRSNAKEVLCKKVKHLAGYGLGKPRFEASYVWAAEMNPAASPNRAPKVSNADKILGLFATGCAARGREHG